MLPFNFGDALGIEVIQKLTDTRFAYGPIKTADIFVTGTVGQLIEMHGGAKPGAILAGIGTDPKKETAIDWPGTYDVRLVRGPLTRDAWKLSKDIPLGDPGIVSREIYGEREKRYDVGFVRHFMDKTDLPTEIGSSERSIVIRADQSPSAVIPLIAACRTLVTSSLHGAIVADSYGIPWRRHRAPVGLDLKWEDYRLAVEQHGIERLKENVTEVLCQI